MLHHGMHGKPYCTIIFQLLADTQTNISFAADVFCFKDINLLSPYPCFISLLYLDLYVLGDDALIS